MQIVKKVELTPEEKGICIEGSVKILKTIAHMCFQMKCAGIDCDDCPIGKCIKEIRIGATDLNKLGG
jgi:hypothetical protein